MPSTKLEIYNVLNCLQRRTEPRPQVTCTGNFNKFGRVVTVVFLRRARRRTERSQRRRLQYSILCSRPAGKVKTWTRHTMTTIGPQSMSKVQKYRKPDEADDLNFLSASTLLAVQYHTHHRNRFTALFPGPPGWAGARRELLDFMVQGEINRGRHTDHPAGRHSIRTNQCPPPPSPHYFFTDCTVTVGNYVYMLMC